MRQKNAHITLLFTFLLITRFVGYSQDSRRILAGLIKDQNDGPLPFVHVYLNDSTGTITNDSGLFVLKARAIHASRLIVSQLGYLRDTLYLSEDSPSDFLVIKLRSAINILDEVVVSTSRARVDSAVIILEQVLQNIRKNYPKKKYSMKGFYRETSMLDTTYSRLLEGYFLVSDKGYGKPIDKLEMKDIHVRKTKDGRDLNWRSSLTEWLYSKNGLFFLLSSDRIRLKSEDTMSNYMEFQENPTAKKLTEENTYRFLSEEFIKKTDCYLAEVIKNENGDKYFVIR